LLRSEHKNKSWFKLNKNKINDLRMSELNLIWFNCVAVFI